MSLDISAFHQATWERFCHVSSMALIVYEFFLQYDQEVRLFWKKPWCFGKCIFFWNRYFSLVYVLVESSDILINHPAMETCRRFNGWNDVGQALLVLSTQFVMQMRVHGMYGNSRTILTLFVIMTVGEVSFWIVFLALGGYVARYGNAGTNNPSPGLYFCADGDFAHKHWYAYFDTPILIIEITLVVLALYKAWQQHRGGNPNRLMMMLARESILYFVVVCAIYAVDQVLNFMNRMTLDELVNGYRNAIPVILANRLMISVRVAYYDHDYVDFDVSSRCTLSISNFRHEHGEARPSSAAFELKRRK